MRQVTSLEMLAEIERLEKQVLKLKSAEVKEVIERIQKAIRHYALTPADLFPADSPTQGKRTAAVKRATVTSTPRPTSPATEAPASKQPVTTKGRKLPPKFKDASGNVWSGRGTTPRWLAAEVAAGKSVEDFAI